MYICEQSLFYNKFYYTRSFIVQLLLNVNTTTTSDMLETTLSTFTGPSHGSITITSNVEEMTLPKMKLGYFQVKIFHLDFKSCFRP
jgi:hypothetical protein